MASQVLSGASNASYTNNTGQNVRLIINYMANVTSMTWAEVNVTADSTTIGKDIQNITGEFKAAVTGKVLRRSNALITNIVTGELADNQRIVVPSRRRETVIREIVPSKGKVTISITSSGRADTEAAKAIQSVYGPDKFVIEDVSHITFTDKTEVYGRTVGGTDNVLLGPGEESAPSISYQGATRNVSTITEGSAFPSESPLSELYSLDGGEGTIFPLTNNTYDFEDGVGRGDTNIFYIPTTVSRGGNFPVELMLAPNESFSAVCGAYNAIVIKEDGT